MTNWKSSYFHAPFREKAAFTGFLKGIFSNDSFREPLTMVAQSGRF